MSTVTPPNISELFEQSARLFENALKAGVAVQQDAAKWFTDTLRGLGVSLLPALRRSQADPEIPAARRSVFLHGHLRRDLPIFCQGID